VPTDPLTYGLVAAALLSVALMASLVPALTASKVDPMDSLREE
jgi:ABC-type lipoprotein release transport system permease subunit